MGARQYTFCQEQLVLYVFNCHMIPMVMGSIFSRCEGNLCTFSFRNATSSDSIVVGMIVGLAI